MRPKDLWYVVNSAKQDLELTSTKHDFVFFKWAIDGFKELVNYDMVPPAGAVVKLYLDANKTADLPSDFIDYYKIGVCVNGYIVNFDLNETICLNRKDACGCNEIESTLNQAQNAPLVDTSWWRTRAHYLGYWEHHNYVGGLFGMGAGFYRGGYRIDYAAGKIQFDSYVNVDYVVMEYQTDGGISDNGNAFVPELLIRPIKNFIHRERCTFRSENEVQPSQKNFMANQALKFGNRYVNGVKHAAQKYKGMTIDQWLATWRASIHQLPKV